MPDLAGKSLGRYRIIEQLGEGGMAIVYRAFDTRLETEVAVKVIRTDNILPSILKDALIRFEREAKLLARLFHPNIVKVTDYGEYEGMPYLVMPYLPGGTLKKLLGKPMPWQEAFKLLIPITEALDYAHSQNMIHRDVKPSNILLTQSGQPMLADFGIAKILDLESSQEITGTSMMIGTPEYMAPEQVTSKTVDHRADIYALGIVLYEMVTGRQPFLADTPMAVLLKHNTEPLPHPRKFVPNLPDAVERILLKALAKNPDERLQSMGEFAILMKGLLANPPAEIKDPYSQSVAVKNTNAENSKPKLSGMRFFMWGTAVVVFCVAVATMLVLLFGGLKKISTTAQVSGLPVSATTPVQNSKPADTQTPVPPSETPGAPAPLPTQILDDKRVSMLLVPAGEFTMGFTPREAQQAFDDCQKETKNKCELSWYSNGMPKHKVILDAYYIDQYEVTNARYAECVTAGDCNPPSPLSSFTRDAYYGRPEFDNYPVIHVSWEDSNAYCRWRDARLPTEAEWEKAARGPDGFRYPWGNEFGGTKLNFCDKNCPLDWANKDYDDGYGDTSPVGSFEDGKSPYGVYDMAGNVWEWVNDWYDAGYYSDSPLKNPQGPETGQFHVTRGGSWSNVYSGLSSSFRSWNVVPSLAQYGYYGFRCARSAAP